MKTPPDDNTLALWLDDELEGEELARVEAWAVDHPDQLEAREKVRDWRKMISDSMPAAEEPPAAEFFNERILQHAAHVSASLPGSGASKQAAWNPIWMPLAACAGMVLAFWLGALLVQPEDPGSANIGGSGNSLSPNLYTPEQGVNAQWISSEDASATVIVLNGVSAIPDEIDFTSIALHRTWREIESSASRQSPTPDK